MLERRYGQALGSVKRNADGFATIAPDKACNFSENCLDMMHSVGGWSIMHHLRDARNEK